MYGGVIKDKFEAVSEAKFVLAYENAIHNDYVSEKIYDVLKKSNSQIEIHIEKDFERAVNFAKSIANKNDIVLLSPACASFDIFDNFMQRGNRFKEIVNSFK